MSKIGSWSTTAANNNSTPPNGWPENQAPSTVNDCAREMMASLKTWHKDAEWLDFNDSPSRASATTFKIAADATSYHLVDRRVKLYDATTLYGTVTAASYSAPDTTITVDLDDGSLTTSLTSVAVGILTPTNTSIPKPTMYRKNLLVGGDFRTNPFQESVGVVTAATSPANNDDTYIADQWILLSDGNDVVDISRDTNGEMISTVQTINKQFGFFQPIENADTIAIFDRGTVSLTIEAKASSGLANIRAAVIAWSSTADSITSDVVGAWAGAGTDPTLATNWTYENTPSNLALSTSYTTYRIPNIAVDTASTANLGVFIWLDDTDGAASDTLTIKRVQLELGPFCTDFETRSISEELPLAKRFYRKTFNLAVRPAQNSGSTFGVLYASGTTASQIAGTAGANWRFGDVTMRTTPSITTYNPLAANSSWRSTSGTADFGTAGSDIGVNGTSILFGSASTANNGYFVHATADARL